VTSGGRRALTTSSSSPSTDIAHSPASRTSPPSRRLNDEMRMARRPRAQICGLEGHARRGRGRKAADASCWWRTKPSASQRSCRDARQLHQSSRAQSAGGARGLGDKQGSASSSAMTDQRRRPALWQPGPPQNARGHLDYHRPGAAQRGARLLRASIWACERTPDAPVRSPTRCRPACARRSGARSFEPICVTPGGRASSSP